MKASLKKLQDANDEALLEFWASIELVRSSKRALHNTAEYLALMMAETQRDAAEVKMSKARSAFLKARLGRSVPSAPDGKKEG